MGEPRRWRPSSWSQPFLPLGAPGSSPGPSIWGYLVPSSLSPLWTSVSSSGPKGLTWKPPKLLWLGKGQVQPMGQAEDTQWAGKGSGERGQRSHRLWPRLGTGSRAGLASLPGPAALSWRVDAKVPGPGGSGLGPCGKGASGLPGRQAEIPLPGMSLRGQGSSSLGLLSWGGGGGPGALQQLCRTGHFWGQEPGPGHPLEEALGWWAWPGQGERVTGSQAGCLSLCQAAHCIPWPRISRQALG